MINETVQDTVVAGATVAGYAIGRLIRNQRAPPVGVALITGGGAVLLAHRANPVLSLPHPEVQCEAAHYLRIHRSMTSV